MSSAASGWLPANARPARISGLLITLACSGCARGTWITSIRNISAFGSWSGRSATQEADSAKAAGAYVATIFGLPRVLPKEFVMGQLDSIVKARNGSGAPTGADSAALRGAVQGIVDKLVAPPVGPNGVRPGPVQCHDITVYPAIGRAGGACAGYGVLLDITDPAHPRRLSAVADSNFAFWHSATFNNDGTQVLFTDEWGGGLGPRGRASDDPTWRARSEERRVG